MVLDLHNALNEILNVSLKLTVEKNGEHFGPAKLEFLEKSVKHNNNFRGSFMRKVYKITGTP